MNNNCDSHGTHGCLADQEVTGQDPLARLAADHNFDRRLALVCRHWASVRHLWLEDPEIPAARKLCADLPGEFWIGCGMPGLATIRSMRDGRFEFTDEGLIAAIIPAYDTIPGMLDTNPERHVEHLTDLIAVDLAHPDRFSRRHGEALILGSAYLEIAAQEGEPLPVFRNPLVWLQAGGEGIVVLDWKWARDLLLGHELIAEDVDLGNQLYAALKPDIWVMENAA